MSIYSDIATTLTGISVALGRTHALSTSRLSGLGSALWRVALQWRNLKFKVQNIQNPPARPPRARKSV
jgi:hypothetical protein